MADLTTPAMTLRGMPSGTEALLVSAGTSIADLVTEASEVFAADVQPRYWPFTGVTDDIPTPIYVQKAVAYLARSYAYEILGRANEMELADEGSSTNTMGHYLRMKAELMADPPGAQIPEIIVVDEVLTFGTDPLTADQHRFNPEDLNMEGFEVIPESVEITGKQHTVDFDTDFSKKDRAWLLTRCDDTIVDGDTVTYRISFLRRREVDLPVANQGGRFERA